MQPSSIYALSNCGKSNGDDWEICQRNCGSSGLNRRRQLFETPDPPWSSSKFGFRSYLEIMGIFGVDDDFIDPFQSIFVEGVEYSGVTLWCLSSVGLVDFGVTKIEIHGNTAFVYEFDQISINRLKRRCAGSKPVRRLWYDLIRHLVKLGFKCERWSVPGSVFALPDFRFLLFFPSVKWNVVETFVYPNSAAVDFNDALYDS